MTKTAGLASVLCFAMCLQSNVRGAPPPGKDGPAKQNVKLVAEVKEYAETSYRLEVEYQEDPKESFLHPGCVIGLFVMPAAAAAAPAFEDLKVIAVIASVGQTVKEDGKYVTKPVNFTGRPNLKKFEIEEDKDAAAVCTSEYYEEASDDEVNALKDFLEKHFGEADEDGDITLATVRFKRLEGKKVRFKILKKENLNV